MRKGIQGYEPHPADRRHGRDSADGEAASSWPALSPLSRLPPERGHDMALYKTQGNEMRERAGTFPAAVMRWVFAVGRLDTCGRDSRTPPNNGPSAPTHCYKRLYRISFTPSCCASFQTTEARYRSSLSETSSRKLSGIPKTLSTRSLAPASDRSTIRHEIIFPYFGTILAGLPSLYRTAFRCSTILPPSILELRNRISVEVVLAKLIRV